MAENLETEGREFQDGLSRFEPTRERAAGKAATKRIALFIFISAGLIFALVVFAIQTSGDNAAMRSSSAPSEIIEASRGSQNFLPPPPPPPEEPAAKPVAVEPTPTPEPEPQPQPQVVRVAQPIYVQASRRERVITGRRREAQAQRLQAASAPSAIAGFGTRSAQPQGSGADSLLTGTPEAYNAQLPGAAQQNPTDTMNLAGMADSVADPNGWTRKEAFLKESLPAEYSQHTRVFPVSALELKAGALLPCVLISGLNTDLPGNMIAQISENVWDTATGRYLLIPRGSRLIGRYDSRLAYGQNRVLVVWNRLIFPDGSSLLLDNLQGADQGGYTGFKGRVNNHFGTLLTSALLVSLIGAGVEAAAPSNDNNNNNNSNNKSVGSVFRERVATAIADVLTQLVKQNLSRQPTITIRQGYRFMIYVQHDVVFPRVWNPALGR